MKFETPLLTAPALLGEVLAPMALRRASRDPRDREHDLAPKGL